MATDVIKTVKSSGGDYSSLAAFHAGEVRDLTAMERAACSNFAGTPFTVGEPLTFTGGATGKLIATDDSSYIRYELSSGTPLVTDTISGSSSMASADIDSFTYQDGEISKAECYAFQDTSPVFFTGWTTDTTRYVSVYTPASERHDGKWNTSAYRLEMSSSSSVPVKIASANIRLDGLQIAPATTPISGIYAVYTLSSSGKLYIANNIIRGRGASIARGISLANIPVPVRIWNNILYDWNGATNYGMLLVGPTSLNCHVYNNTVHNCLTGYRQTGVTGIIAINNIAYACTDGFNGTFDSGSDYNLSDLASDAPGSNSKNSATVTFVDEGGDDFHLASSDTGAKDSGYDLSGDSTLPITDDIDGEIRSGTYDIGADEYVAAGLTLLDFERGICRGVGVGIMRGVG